LSGLQSFDFVSRGAAARPEDGFEVVPPAATAAGDALGEPNALGEAYFTGLANGLSALHSVDFESRGMLLDEPDERNNNRNNEDGHADSPKKWAWPLGVSTATPDSVVASRL
jgi:hypothetical protein